jgi:hypothetical protein
LNLEEKPSLESQEGRANEEKKNVESKRSRESELTYKVA